MIDCFVGVRLVGLLHWVRLVWLGWFVLDLIDLNLMVDWLVGWIDWVVSLIEWLFGIGLDVR